MGQDDLLEIVARQAQEAIKLRPVMLIGSGPSIAMKVPGMGALAEHLVGTIAINDIAAEEDKEGWKEFSNLLKASVDLETALHRVPLSESVERVVIEKTWELIAQHDLKVFGQFLSREITFPLAALIRHYFASTHAKLDIITTNYDRLIEYACDEANVHHYSGFSKGYLGTPVSCDYLKAEHQVNVWKVHGSLSWFKQEKSQQAVSIPFSNNLPQGHSPAIVTPGVNKYRRTYEEPFIGMIHSAYSLLESSTSYLCIGFGFNDDHIQERLVRNCTQGKGTSVVVITRTLTDSAREFIFKQTCGNYLAIERSENGSRIYSSQLTKPLELNTDYWSLGGFLNLIL